MPIEFANCILKVYLKYVYEMKLKYIKELYSCTDYDNIWKLIKLTEKNDAEKYDFLKIKDYILYDIC